MIQQTFTPESFTKFAFDQLRKASEEDLDMAQLRVLALNKSIEIAKQSFETSTTASVPVIEAPPTDTTVSPKAAFGPDHGHAVSNPQDLGEALNKALADLEKAMAGKTKTEDKSGEAPVAKSDQTFDELDTGDWPGDLSVGKADPEWGGDPAEA